MPYPDAVPTTFQICTLVTNNAQYDEMKASFVQGGFVQPRCTYTTFDNTAGNRWDPYECISAILRAAVKTVDDREYIIFCHQDVVLNRGHDIEHLADRLASLEETDPHWAVAGNAGVTDRLEGVVHLADVYGDTYYTSLPKRVVTLDENLLIIKPVAGLRCTPGLSGFHLYATDLCLNAMIRRRSVYVIDFRLEHKSGGNVGADFYAAQHNLQRAWAPYFVGAVIAAPTNTFAFSRFRLLARLLNSGRATNFAAGHKRLTGMLLKFNRMFLRPPQAGLE